MIHILLENHDIAAPYLLDTLKQYILPEHKVLVFPFAFNDMTLNSAEAFDARYARHTGSYWEGLVSGFAAYGIPEKQVNVLNYFIDTAYSAAEKLAEADIVYFLGGLPDRMMERLHEFELVEALSSFSGIMMGYSAGALIQLSEYHLSPDDDYPGFGYYQGLNCIHDWYLEVHYDACDVQQASIERVLHERSKPVYALQAHAGGLVIDEQGEVIRLGETFVFER